MTGGRIDRGIDRVAARLQKNAAIPNRGDIGVR